MIFYLGNMTQIKVEEFIQLLKGIWGNGYCRTVKGEREIPRKYLLGSNRLESINQLQILTKRIHVCENI